MIPRIGVLTVKGKEYHPTNRLAEAAASRGAAVVPINPYRVWPSYVNGSPGLYGLSNASEIAAVLPRQGAEIKTACLPLIAHFAQMGVRVVNGLESIQIARNKFFMLQAMTRAGLPVPDTLFATSPDGCREARKFFAPDKAVIKPINGRQGTGLHCLSPKAPVPSDIDEQLHSGRGVLVQAYIPARHRQDYRVFVIGDQVVGAIVLQPPAGDFRTNVHIGGQPAPGKLSPDLCDLAVKAAAAVKLEIAGVDMIVGESSHPLIIEVNSAPGFRAMEKTVGVDIAGAIMDYVLSVIPLG